MRLQISILSWTSLTTNCKFEEALASYPIAALLSIHPQNSSLKKIPTVDCHLHHLLGATHSLSSFSEMTGLHSRKTHLRSNQHDVTGVAFRCALNHDRLDLLHGITVCDIANSTMLLHCIHSSFILLSSSCLIFSAFNFSLSARSSTEFNLLPASSPARKKPYFPADIVYALCLRMS